MTKDVEPRTFPGETETRFQGFVMRDQVREDLQKIKNLYDEFISTDQGRKSLDFYYERVPERLHFEAMIDETEYRNPTTVISPGGKVIGFGCYTVNAMDPQIAFFSRLIVPEYQGKGIGTALIGHMIKRCRQQYPNIVEMESLTAIQNVAAVKSLTKAIETLGGSRENAAGRHVRFKFPVR